MHCLVETAASVNFIFNPEQLPSDTLQTSAISLYYVTLLSVSVAISSIFASCPIDRISGRVAGALSWYHLAVLYITILKLVYGDDEYGQRLGGPWVHLIAHGACWLSLVELWLRGGE